MAWFAACFQSGTEIDAARSLDGIEARAFCPIERRSWIVRGRSVSATLPVISGYAFVEMTAADDGPRWHEVVETRGFMAFVGVRYGDVRRPDPIRPRVVEELMARADDATWEIDWTAIPDPDPPFARGELVRLPDGLIPHTLGIVGTVEWVHRDGERAEVSFRGLFAREHRLAVLTSVLKPVEARSKRDRFTLLNLPVRRSVTEIDAKSLHAEEANRIAAARL